jgi:hypothetical protein
MCCDQFQDIELRLARVVETRGIHDDHLASIPIKRIAGLHLICARVQPIGDLKARVANEVDELRVAVSK